LAVVIADARLELSLNPAFVDRITADSESVPSVYPENSVQIETIELMGAADVSFSGHV